MKVPEIKRLIETYSLQELQKAEESLLEEMTPAIEINGVDEGEQLTHAMAAIWCKKAIETKQISINDAVREYTIKVRKSIN